MEQFHGTTIVSVRRGNKVAIGGDGQVTFGESMIMKATARKVRKLYNDRVLAGLAGATADAFTLMGIFEGKLQTHQGNLLNAAIDLAKEWRTDKVLRNFQAMLIVADKEHTLIISGTGDVLEPEEGIAAIGSGGPFALSAAKALFHHTKMNPEEICKKSLEIAADICVFTNHNHIIETL